MKTFVIGDVHGRCAQMLSLLEMIPREDSSDTLVFLDLMTVAQMPPAVLRMC